MLKLETGDIFASRYEILRRLDADECGSVYLASDVEDPSLFVTITFLPDNQPITDLQREWLASKISSLHQLTHPNVFQAYEHFDAGEYQAFAVEYVEGRTIRERFRDAPITLAEGKGVLLQVISALQEAKAHNLELFGLDAKNVYLTNSLRVKIKPIEALGLHALLAGQKEPTDQSEQIAVAALALLAYEMVCGSAPFANETEGALSLLTSKKLKLVNLERCGSEDAVELITRSIDHTHPQHINSIAAFEAALSELEFNAAPPAINGDISTARQQSRSSYRPGTTSMWEQSHDTPSPQIETLRKNVRNFKIKIPVEYRSLASTLIAAAAGAFIVCTVGFASRILYGDQGQLQKLPNGVYQGLVTGLPGTKEPTPLGVWSLPEKTLALLGIKGCAVGTLMSDGSYSCGEVAYSFKISEVTTEGASGFVSSAVDEATVGSWSISLADPPIATPEPKLQIELATDPDNELRVLPSRKKYFEILERIKQQEIQVQLHSKKANDNIWNESTDSSEAEDSIDQEDLGSDEFDPTN